MFYIDQMHAYMYSGEFTDSVRKNTIPSTNTKPNKQVTTATLADNMTND